MTLRNKLVVLASTAILLTTPVLGNAESKSSWGWARDTQTSQYIYQTQSLGVENIVPRVINAVVSVTTMKYSPKQTPEDYGVKPDLEEDSPLNEFLEDSSLVPIQQDIEPGGYGSGFFIGDNLIVTNHHVIENGVQDEYLISLPTKKWYSYKARLISADELTDIAVLEIIAPDNDINNIVPLNFARTLPRLGEPVFAIGHPHGLMWTVTQGVTSYINRRINNIWQELVQTDTAVNPGNSGGPLFNLRGEVVGVNVMIMGRDVGGQPNETGLNFAVSSEVTKHVVSELLQYDRVRRPRMGISLDDFEELNSEKGVWVREIEPDSPAEKAGLKVNDTISGVDDVRFRNSIDFFTWFAKKMPGDRVKLKVIRGEEFFIMPVILDERIEAFEAKD